MIKLNVKHTVIHVANLGTLVEGNINSILLQFVFSQEWDSLAKVAVFTNGSTSKSVTLTSNICAIPWEVLATQGNLYISLRGVGNGGELVICTKNEFLGKVEPSCASGDVVEAEEATPTVIDTLLSDVEELKQNSGCGSGADGRDGRDGVDGQNGITPHIGANGNWFIDNTDTGLPSRGSAGQNGTDGADGNVIVVDNSLPSTAGHNEGDIFINSTTFDVYKYKAGPIEDWILVGNIKGPAGADGHTPVMGTDYWTAVDKQGIVNDVLAALPTWTGGSY